MGAFKLEEELQKTVELDQEALAIARRIRNRELEGRALGLLGVVHSTILGEYHKVIEFAQKGLAIAREIKNPEIEVLSLFALGGAYTLLGEPQKGSQFLQQSSAFALSATASAGSQ